MTIAIGISLLFSWVLFRICGQSFSISKPDLRPSTCIPIEISMCKGIGYNLTYIPNDLNHASLEEAGLEIQQFNALVEINCSEDLRLFLCSMYAPICLPNWPNRIPACRSLCISAREGCTRVMNQYGFKWPEGMNCEKLPEDNACLRKDNKTRSNKTTNFVSERPYLLKSKKCHCHCRSPLIIDSRDHFNKVVTGNISNCLMNCRSPYFGEFDKSFSTFWLGIWACVCIISTSVTILTFCIDKSRFQYPERPIIFLSICYLLMSVGYLIRVALGHEAVACKSDAIRYGSSGAVPCSIVFLFIYFFGMASSIWWVVLTATWFLAAGLKWGSEAILMYADIYHFFAWFIPGIQSIIILTMSSVDGDPVSGICYVGNLNKYNLLFFVIIPLIVYLLVGTGFLLAGFLALMKIRKTIKEKGESKTDKLEKLMIRISIFGIVYSVPTMTVVFCSIYEFIFRDLWEQSYTCPCRTKKYQPEYSVFMLKYFMNLVVGTTAGFWIWTPKTLDSWSKVFCKLLCCRKSLHYKVTCPTQLDKPLCKPETLSTKALLYSLNSSYNVNDRQILSASNMIRSGITLSNSPDSETLTKLISLTHV
uniref:Fzd-5/8-1 n=1 Tax=Schmidtea mediterranea TaxID=79327 RepID=T1E0Z7_SCHMD|nr:hypothetical protein Smed-fzd-5/8-1 [Schmidtea mediterranea]